MLLSVRVLVVLQTNIQSRPQGLFRFLNGVNGGAGLETAGQGWQNTAETVEYFVA